MVRSLLKHSSHRGRLSPIAGFFLGVPVFSFLILSGCATPADHDRSSGSLAADMFVTAFNDIEAVYIREPDLADIAYKSLGSLTAIDSAFSVRRAPAAIEIDYGTKLVGKKKIDPNLSPTTWGEIVGDFLDEAMADSPLLRADEQENIFEAMLSPAVKSLDNFSRYSGAEAAAESRASREGFGGIGVRISVEDDIVLVTAVMHYTPAERMGLKQGDIILAIDGVPVKGLTEQQVVNRLRGPVDSKLLITLKRHRPSQPDEFSVVLKRAHVVPETVTYRREGNFAYFHIYGFNAETTESLKRALSDVDKEKGSPIKGLILDLRDNPGGLLDQSVSLADLFLRDGRIVSTHGRHPESHQFFEASGEDVTGGLPIALLINGNSASAAEIVAAALQDNHRAVLVGSNSFGKGTVQTVLPLPNKGEITLTWARFHAPSGYTLHGLGVLPNICTNGNESAAQILDRLKRGVIPPLPITERNAAGPDDEKAHQKLRQTCPARSEESEIDLNVAKELLERPDLFQMALKLAEPEERILKAAGDGADASDPLADYDESAE